MESEGPGRATGALVFSRPCRCGRAA